MEVGHATSRGRVSLYRGATPQSFILQRDHTAGLHSAQRGHTAGFQGEHITAFDWRHSFTVKGPHYRVKLYAGTTAEFRVKSKIPESFAPFLGSAGGGSAKNLHSGATQ